MIIGELEKIGFAEYYIRQVDSEKLTDLQPARVTAVHRDRFTLSNGDKAFSGELLGKMLFAAETPEDLPTVGDWVLVSAFEDDQVAIIHDLLPRKSLLKRKTPGKKTDIQLIAANIDTAFIIQSLNENFNLRRLERYLVMINESKIEPVVLLSKSDLSAEEDIKSRTGDIQAVMPELTVISFSNENIAGWGNVQKLLHTGKTYCLLGSSGVGKTTLLNNLIGEARFSTKDVSKKQSKGRHTTTNRQLTVLSTGAMIIDTPGMRELGNIAVDSGLEDTFSELIALEKRCRFSDCSHESENGCAILAAMEQGELSRERYESYMKMRRESSFNEMSYIEKRQKNRKLGKFYRTIQQEKRNRKSSE